MILRLTKAPKGAVFTLTQGRPTLRASKRIDQVGLDLVPRLWDEQRAALCKDEVLQGEIDPSADEDAQTSYALVPVLEAPGNAAALVYLESDVPGFRIDRFLGSVRKLSRLVRKAASMPLTSRLGLMSEKSWETFLEETPREEIERQQLLVLLRKNEWNIARVARIMGMTRRTVYLKLERYGIPRQRVPKSRRRLRSDYITT
jgi:hypothetical protein